MEDLSDEMVNKLARTMKAKQVHLTNEQLGNAKLIMEAAIQFGIQDRRQLAYMLSTALAECSLRCIREIKRESNPQYWENQKKYWDTGYYGRGFTQITHKYNYEGMGKKLGLDLAANPDLALDPATSAQIIAIGMRDGDFSTKKLSDYFNSTTEDWNNARRIINGLDRACEIGGDAKKIYEA